MGQFFAYSLQSAICLAVFYLFYKALLSRETFHRFNRMALLGILVLSLIIPLALTLFPAQSVAMTDMDLLLLSAEEDTLSENMKHTAGYAKNKTGNAFLSLLLIIYLSGCILLLTHSVVSIIRIIRIIRKGTCLKNETGTKLIISENEKISPFSWMNHIILSRSDYKEAGDTIMVHESAHIRLNHTHDLMVAQVCLIMQWFNPAAWLLYRELQDIHEYEADEAVIHQGIDAKKYQLLLIKKAVGTRLYSMANSFTHSNLKKRITMMLQKKSNSRARLKYAYILPLAVATVAAFARPEISKQFEEIASAKVSHFAFTTSTNEVKNLPETTTSFLQENIPEMEFTVKPVDKTESYPVSNATPQDSVFIAVEHMPEFPGGISAMTKWVMKNLSYPESAAYEGIQGNVICSYIIEKDGSVSDIQVVRSIDPALDEEAKRVLMNLPKFTPGRHKGKEVRVKCSVPVRFTLSGNHSDNAPTPPSTTQKPERNADPNFVYDTAEYMPQFPGGELSLIKWVSENIKYPENAKKNGIQGRVPCKFIVNADGSVSDVQIVRPVEPELDAEAIRVLQTLPKFTPGTIDGKAVRVRYSVPVRFKFDS